MRWMLPLLLCVASVAPLSAGALDGEFALPAPSRSESRLFEIKPRDSGGGGFDQRWPWDGIEVSAYTGMFPVVLAVSQAVDVGIPVLPWVSAVLRVEGTAGLLFTGGIFDFGVRGHFNFSDRFGIYGEVMGRYGIGELTIAEIFEDFFQEYIDAGVDTVGGFGFSLAAGIEFGGRHMKFIAGVEYGALFIDGNAWVENIRFTLPTITVNYFGFQVGMRFYFG